jgi:4-hydroxy-tetrahydrodipicolinate synthase
MTEPIQGVVAPVVTPFDDASNLAIECVADSVEFTLNCGCHAVVASGTGVQETSALSPSERKALISATVEAVDGRVPVLAGVSYPAQSLVTELIDHAENEGVDGLLAMPPWGLLPSQSAIVRYYTDIAAATELPILVYNNPAVTVDMDKETMLDVAKIDGVEYVKESSRDWQKVGWLIERIQHGCHADVFATMDVLLPTLQSGGKGAVVPAPASVTAMDIYDAHEAGEIGEAIAAQRTFGTFPPDEVDTGLTAVCKAGHQLAGVDVGQPRPPYSQVSEAGRDAIDAWLDEAGVPRP